MYLIQKFKSLKLREKSVDIVENIIIYLILSKITFNIIIQKYVRE